MIRLFMLHDLMRLSFHLFGFIPMNIKLLSSTALLALVPMVLMGCSMTENHLKMDRETDTNMQDMRDMFGPREVPAPLDSKTNATGIPGFTDYMSDNAASLKPMPLVSVSVNETIPLKDVLYELSQQAHYDLEIDPRIDGAIIFSAKNRPFDEVMSRISDLAGLRFNFDNDVVRVEMDTPYSETYKVDYLPMARTVTSTVQNNASFAGSGSASGGSATSSSGSTFSLSGTTEVDFWKELDTNIKQILESNSVKNALLSATTPVLQPTPVAASTIPAAVGPDGESIATDPNAPEGTDTVPTDAQAPAQPPTAPTPAPAPTESGPASEDLKPTYSVNKQAGLLSVFANEKVQKKIRAYLNDVKQSVGSQVLIEAKILQVDLTDEYATGINWSELGISPDDLEIGLSNITAGLTPAATGRGFSLKLDNKDTTSLIEAVSRFGTVRALSSPRMTVLNKQSAVLNVATNKVYFEISQEPTATNVDGGTTGGGITVETKSVPEGVLVNVTPSIDARKGEIVLNLRPTITKTVGNGVTDPSIKLITPASTATNIIPELSVQEFDSVLKVKSGETVIMGGLIQDSSESSETGAPLLSEIPLFGSLFKNHSDNITKSEIIVFLRATIVNTGEETIHQTDRDMYKMFSRDRRPIPM